METQILSPAIVTLSFFPRREGFTYPVETNAEWAMLGCLRGSFEFAIGGGPRETCEAGQFLVCPPGEALARKSHGPLGFYFLRFNWPGADALTWRGRHGLVDLVRLESTLIHLELVSHQPLAAAAKAWADHLLADLLQQRAFERSTRRTDREVDRDMVLAAETIKRDLARPDSLERLAESLQLTPSQFSRRFTAAFGTTPVAYRTDLRMQEARRRLIETGDKLQTVAEACGYENAFYFTRVFTRENGLSPGRFRTSRRV